MTNTIIEDQKWYATRLGLNSSDAVRLIKAARHYVQEIRSLANASKNGAVFSDRAKLEFILDRPKFILVNAVRELKNAARRGQGVLYRPRSGAFVNEMPSLEELEADVATVASVPLCHAKRRYQKPKPSGGTRLICEFDTVNRARQLILKDLVEATDSTGVRDYATAGNGRDAAIRQIMAYIQGGYHHWVDIDIKNAFPSVKKSHVMELLPIRMPHTSIACITVNSGIPTNPVDWQLPQGGLASQSILSALIGREVRAHLSDTGSVCVFVDNIWIGARTRASAERHLAELTERFRTLDAGPLELSHGYVRSLKRGERFAALGYQFRWFSDTNEFRCAIANSSFEKFETKLFQKLDEKPTDVIEAEFERYFSAWLSSFSARTISEFSETSYRVSCERRFREYQQRRLLEEMIND